VLVGSPLTLGLSAAELDRIQAGTLTVGGSDSGHLRITANVVRAAATDVTLVSGGAIVFDPGSIDTAGGDLLLAPGTAVRPLTAGTEATAGVVSFADGSQLKVAINGTEVDTEYSQLNVGGAVDLAGVQLALDGTHVPEYGDVFAVVSGTSLANRFHGLEQGAQVLFNGIPLTVHYTDTAVNLYAPTVGATRIEMTIVREPSETTGAGEVGSLRASAQWVHEWELFWVEIWVSTPESTTVGVAQAKVDLQYHSGYLTAQEIVYGPAWDHPVVVIDDKADFVSLHGWTNLTDVGDDAYVLLARVRFGSTGNDQAPVVPEEGFLGPYDMALDLEDGQTRLVGGAADVPELGGAPDTQLWAVMYDFGSVESDVEENNQIDFGDLSFFAAAFGKAAGPFYPPYTAWADFDRSGRVDFGDLAFFAPNFGKTRAAVQSGAQTLVFPPNFPDAWRPGSAAPTGEGEAGTFDGQPTGSGWLAAAEPTAPQTSRGERELNGAWGRTSEPRADWLQDAVDDLARWTGLLQPDRSEVPAKSQEQTPEWDLDGEDGGEGRLVHWDAFFLDLGR
jgi:hypothetical protein